MDRQQRVEFALQICQRMAKDAVEDRDDPVTANELENMIDGLAEFMGCKREKAEDFVQFLFPDVPQPVRVPAGVHGSAFPLRE